MALEQVGQAPAIPGSRGAEGGGKDRGRPAIMAQAIQAGRDQIGIQDRLGIRHHGNVHRTFGYLVHHGGRVGILGGGIVLDARRDRTAADHDGEQQPDQTLRPQGRVWVVLGCHIVGHGFTIARGLN